MIRAALTALIVSVVSDIAQAEDRPVIAHIGYQFRLLWPETGHFSPDVFAEQAAHDAQAYIFCGEAAFANGENFEALGTPFQGLLLAGFAGNGGVENRAGSAEFHLVDPNDSGWLPNGPLSFDIHVTHDQTVWIPISFFPVEANLHMLSGGLDMDSLNSLPELLSGCAE